jgi:hypothetical protein
MLCDKVRVAGYHVDNAMMLPFYLVSGLLSLDGRCF